MSKFNKTTKNINKTVNYEGEESYILSNEMELYSLVCTTTISNKFYEGSKQIVQRLRDLVNSVDHKFTAKLAIYVRNEMYLRSVPLVLIVELAKIHSGDNLISKTIQRVVNRADDITELLSYYQISGKRNETKKLNKISNQIKKGIRMVFESSKFDEYQYSKYNRNTEVRLRDALFITHPKPSNNHQKGLFYRIANDCMETAHTWETQMSEAGKKNSPVTTKKKIWEDMIDSNKMGYMATLRNLKNMLNEGVSLQHMEKVCAYLSDPVAVSKSKQLPFRFLSAYRMLVGNSWNRYNEYDEHIIDNDVSFLNMVLVALESAITYSIQNIPMFDNENVLIATDVSASMISPVSKHSVVTMYDIGTVLAMIMYKKCNTSVTGMFGNTYKNINLPKNNILKNADEIYKREGEVGYSTNGYKVIQYAYKHNVKFDRIMMFTDCQLWNSTMTNSSLRLEWNKYKLKNPNCKLCLFDLNGYGNLPIDLSNKDVTLISGWSDKIFNVLSSIESGDDTLKLIYDIEI